jgi:hypothetical protein
LYRTATTMQQAHTTIFGDDDFILVKMPVPQPLHAPR